MLYVVRGKAVEEKESSCDCLKKSVESSGGIKKGKSVPAPLDDRMRNLPASGA